MNNFVYINTVLLLINTSVFAQDDLAIKSSVQLKNLYADRDYAEGEDFGSWSQGFLYNGLIEKKINDLKISVLPTVQYAYRLNSDKYISDGIFAYDSKNKSQENDYYKLGVGFKLGYHDQYLQIGDLNLNTPITGADPTRQLSPLYKGIEVGKNLLDGYDVKLGYVNRYSPRNESDYRKLTVSNIESDGLYYLNFNNVSNKKNQYNFYYGDLQNLFSLIHLGLSFDLLDNENIQNNLKIKYFSIFDTGNSLLGDINTNYYGVMNTISNSKISLGVGYQAIDGNSNLYLLDGAVPATHFINWTQGAFNKQDEKSFHINTKVDLKDYIDGLNLNYRYIYGDNFLSNQKENTEIERDYILNYNAKNILKGLDFQLIYVNYDIKYGRDYDELRFLTSYKFNF